MDCIEKVFLSNQRTVPIEIYHVKSDQQCSCATKVYVAQKNDIHSFANCFSNTRKVSISQKSKNTTCIEKWHCKLRENSGHWVNFSSWLGAMQFCDTISKQLAVNVKWTRSCECTRADTSNACTPSAFVFPCFQPEKIHVPSDAVCHSLVSMTRQSKSISFEKLFHGQKHSMRFCDILHLTE